MIVLFIVACATYSVVHVLKTSHKTKGAAHIVVPVKAHPP